MRQGYPRGVSVSTSVTPLRVGPPLGLPGILTPVLDRPRTVTLAWAGVCAALFLVLAFLVHLQRAPLNGLDDLGRSAEQWASGQVRAAHRPA